MSNNLTPPHKRVLEEVELAKKKNGAVELTDSEIDYLKQIHVAQTLKEWMQHPGWEIYTGLIRTIVERMEAQHLGFAESAMSIPSRDAYWVSGMRLGGIRTFAKILEEEIGKRVGLLDQPLRAPQPPDPADFDGELPNRNGQSPEGE